jgi:hypothetical protein
VVDEGHVSANVDANLTTFARTLCVERRWIVTGTPTTHLLGLSLGKNSEASAEAAPSEDTDVQMASPDDVEDDDERKGEEEEDRPQVARAWNDYDRDDLRKLSAMMIHFLSVPHLSGTPKIFDNSVISPLFEKAGPYPGAIRVLEQVMEMQMIRHQ